MRKRSMNDFKVKIKDDISIVLCGEAGMGIQTVESILTRLLKLSGYNVFATKEYMSRVRGGANSIEIRISSKRVNAFVDKIDILIPLNEGAIYRIKKRISSDTIVFGEKELVEKDFVGIEHKFIDVPFLKIANEIGDAIYSNIIVVGLLLGILNIEPEQGCNYIEQFFSSKKEDVIKKNVEAIKKGYKIAENLTKSETIKIDIKRNKQAKIEILLNGTEAVGLGAIAGGCNFISAYPMSPSTGVFVFLSNQIREFDIISEQAEDEISAINMVIGAWIAGGRGLVTTSGGGFALMEEGLSLTGMLETPLVIHLAQRPAPATGLPTRTEQADLELALYAGHGEFPRIIFTPGTIEDAFYLTQKAFNLADKFQIPVFILTDQYFVDSYYNIPSLDLSKIKNEKYTIEANKGYQRYTLTENGISPRAIPGVGSEIVIYNGNEHDELGEITEDPQIRAEMVEKRLKKLELIKKEVIFPELIGDKDYKILIIGWGSTRNVLVEALERLRRDDVAFLYFKQVYPLHEKTNEFLKKAKQTIIVENNATSQFSKLIKLYTDIEIDTKILKYDGNPFSVEEIMHKLKNNIN